MQYTIRGISASLDLALRERARHEGKSLNQVAVEALAEGLGVSSTRVVRRDLDDISGSWKKDPALEKALAEQDRIDPALWA